MNSKIIICDRYDIDGVTNRDDLIFRENPEYFIHFFEWLDNPGYYFIHSGREDDGDVIYHRLNNTGKYDFGDGFGRANVSEPTSIGIFAFNFGWRFLEFIKENHVVGKIPDKLCLGMEDRAWQRIEKFEPENWLDVFCNKEFEKQKLRWLREQEGMQLDLFV